MAPTLSVVTIVNNEALYAQFRRSLAQTSLPIQFLPVHADPLGWNAALALNAGIAGTSGEWIILAHQDVVCPPHWVDRLVGAIERLPTEVAVVGLVGIRPNGGFAGHVRDPHGHLRWPPLPARVWSLDEHLIVLKRRSGLRFDPANPGFHCYGTDLCLTARNGGLTALVIDNPVVHLSGGRLDESFAEAADWLLTKWGGETGGVIPTCARLLYRARIGNLWRVLRIRASWRRSQSPARSRCACTQTESPLAPATWPRPDSRGAGSQVAACSKSDELER